MSHTKGEWKIFNEMSIESDKGLSIANIYWNSELCHTIMVSKEEGIANVKLIAAAPDMLEALQDSLQMLEQTLSYRENNDLKAGNIFLESTIEKVKSVIKKATT